MLNPLEGREVASGLSELLLDFGDYVTGGRRPWPVLVFGAWTLTLGGGLALWRWFPWLFDHFPGWAVIAGAGWAMVFVVSLGLFGAAVKHAAAKPPS